MIKTICLLFSVLLFQKATAQQPIAGHGHSITFKFKISEIAAPDTVAILWFPLPYVQGKTVEQLSVFPNPPGTDGLYQQTITFPDSLLGKTIGYLYTANGNQYDIFRTFILDKNQATERIENWGHVDGLAGKVKVSPMLFIEPDSPEEATAFAKPYTGITTNGTPIKDLFPIKKTGYSTLAIKNAVVKFTSTLTKEQKALSVFPVNSDEWRRWHNIEQWNRAGICLENMTAQQKELVFDILQESLSARGLQKAKDIMSMEAYLATLVPGNKNLGGEKYWFTFYGTPSDTEPYGWQIEGHHLVINYFILGDQVVMTPTFMGSEPTLVEKGENQGLRTFVAEEKKGLDFYLSLDSAQKKEARLWNKKDMDFNRGEAFRDNEIIATTGIAAAKLSKAQQDALLDLIAEYVNNIRDGQAKVKMTDVKLHLNETHFTWVQGDNIESPFYYRIHSPVILIEFDHQTPVFIHDPSKPRGGPVKTHIHTVVRTPNGNDYGKDLLREHLEKHHKHKKK
jgi:hypothetical protein